MVANEVKSLANQTAANNEISRNVQEAEKLRAEVDAFLAGIRAA